MCRPLDKSLLGSTDMLKVFFGQGVFLYVRERKKEFGSGRGGGVGLMMDWSLMIGEAMKKMCVSTDNLREILEQAGVWLCPHRNLADAKIVNIILRMTNPRLNMMSSG